MTMIAGRTCPIAYQYGAAALAVAPTRRVKTLYVVGGLYGNPFALTRIQSMAAAEAEPVTICFNGDFNWFNTDGEGFSSINLAVLQHQATQGNVEFELGNSQDTAGCGCAYPHSVDQRVVDRSNRIHARLKEVATRHPDLMTRLATLPLFARYEVGSMKIGVVHGDANSLAGWQFDGGELDKPENQSAITRSFHDADVDIFASSHTCLPALRQFSLAHRTGVIVNNGAAGLPNFRGERSGLLTRVSLYASPHVPLYGMELNEIRIDALPITYDYAAWQHHFLSNWPVGSDAYTSYFWRIANGPEYMQSQAQLSPELTTNLALVLPSTVVDMSAP